MNEEDLVEEWTDDDRLIKAIDDEIEAMYWDYRDEDEDFDDFQGEMGYKISEPIDNELYEVLYDCRK